MTYECANCFRPARNLDKCAWCLSEAVFFVRPLNLEIPTVGQLSRTESGLWKYPEREWQYKISEFKFRCAYCGNHLCEGVTQPAEHQLTKDHVIPISRGGVDILCNVVPADLRCNRMKLHLTASEFISERPGLCKAAKLRRRNQQVLFSLIEELSRQKKLPFGPPPERPSYYYADRRKLLAEQAEQIKKGVQHVLSTNQSTRSA